MIGRLRTLCRASPPLAWASPSTWSVLLEARRIANIHRVYRYPSFQHQIRLRRRPTATRPRFETEAKPPVTPYNRDAVAKQGYPTARTNSFRLPGTENGSGPVLGLFAGRMLL